MRWKSRDSGYQIKTVHTLNHGLPMQLDEFMQQQVEIIDNRSLQTERMTIKNFVRKFG